MKSLDALPVYLYAGTDTSDFQKEIDYLVTNMTNADDALALIFPPAKAEA